LAAVQGQVLHKVFQQDIRRAEHHVFVSRGLYGIVQQCEPLALSRALLHKGEQVSPQGQLNKRLAVANGHPFAQGEGVQRQAAGAGNRSHNSGLQLAHRAVLVCC